MKKTLPNLVTQGICLRPLGLDDLPLTLAWRNRDEARIWFKNSAIISTEMHHAWFEGYERKNSDYVFIIEAGATPVGQASVYNIDMRTGSAEVGRFLAAPEHRGKGYVNAACAALLTLCKDYLHLDQLYLEVFSNNLRAIRLYEHHGFLITQRQDNLLRMERKL
jgi:diamine N-acetyltransferase